MCDLLDGDRSPKPVIYCGFCDAWLCDRCKQDMARRARAAAARVVQKVTGDAVQ